MSCWLTVGRAVCTARMKSCKTKSGSSSSSALISIHDISTASGSPGEHGVQWGVLTSGSALEGAETYTHQKIEIKWDTFPYLCCVMFVTYPLEMRRCLHLANRLHQCVTNNNSNVGARVAIIINMPHNRESAKESHVLHVPVFHHVSSSSLALTHPFGHQGICSRLRSRYMAWNQHSVRTFWNGHALQVMGYRYVFQI